MSASYCLISDSWILILDKGRLCDQKMKEGERGGMEEGEGEKRDEEGRQLKRNVTVGSSPGVPAVS